MKKAFLLFIVLVTTLTSCTKDKDPAGETADETNCLQTKISSFSSSFFICPSGATVKEYTFQNNTVFVFDVGNCGADMTSEVIDVNCNTLGYLGGIAGNVVISGANFSTANYVRTIWNN